MILSGDDAFELYCGGLDGYEVLEKDIVDQGRWSTYYRVVFRKDGELWAFDWERGSTENQDVEQPKTVDCFQVEAVQVTTYKPIPKPRAASVPVPAPPKAKA